MFIIEKPYASEYMINSIINHDWAVLENETISHCGIEEDAFRLWSTEKAVQAYLMQEYPLIYSNSETALDWVVTNLPKSNLTRYIKLFKDKIAFREELKEAYPNFYFKSIEYQDIDRVKKEDYKYPLVLKPSIGFLSAGVHVIEDVSKWDDEVKKMQKEISSIKSIYPEAVVNTTKILAEEYVEGKEYAIDAYYDRNGTPVILNIFHHMQDNKKDVRDRLYITSTSIMIQYMAKIAQLLREMGEKFNIRNFPLHIEVKVNTNGDIIPIEVNPMRFAGWCTTDIAKFAWGINVYECFSSQTFPDWNSILSGARNEIYYFSMIDMPQGYPRNSIRGFDYAKYLSHFSKVLEFRQINYTENPLFGIVFGSTTSQEELQTILNLDTTKYIL